ncbi:MAG: ornithine cyclodeaminase family protein [Flavobacteriaceae bacterium]|nr:ornithine cyclodeaminase family protein [Flavobacteriaceae bacterium]
MDIPFISTDFINKQTDFSTLINAMRRGFGNKDIIIPMRHHHDFPNGEGNSDSTLLLMPAWNPGQDAGVKVVTVSPDNDRFNMPSIQGSYIYLDAEKGSVKAILEAKSLTAKRTAAASALASSFLSRPDSKSLLMIGTGALSSNLIMAHAAVRPINTVYVWGRDLSNAQQVCCHLKEATFECLAISDYSEVIGKVDIISCATLSKVPLVFGKELQTGQHIDLVGAYRKDMREADDAAITKASVFVDTFQGGLKESGDILIPLTSGILDEKDVLADLFQMCSVNKPFRKSSKEITLFKSVGHAIEDLIAANYYYDKFINAYDYISKYIKQKEV